MSFLLYSLLKHTCPKVSFFLVFHVLNSFFCQGCFSLFVLPSSIPLSRFFCSLSPRHPAKYKHGLVKNDLILEGCTMSLHPKPPEKVEPRHKHTCGHRAPPPSHTPLLTTGPHTDVSGSLRLHFCVYFFHVRACMLACCRGVCFFTSFSSSLQLLHACLWLVE